MASVRTYYRELVEIAARRGFWMKPLGHLDGYPTWLVMTKKPFDSDVPGPKLLITAGIHGEEQAGPLAMLKWADEVEDLTLAKANISFIPIINSYGFANKKRYGVSGIPTNGGFGGHKTQDPSPEGQIIVNNIGILRPLAEDGFMALHEDLTVSESYLYTMENEDSPSKFTKSLRRELSKYFPKVYDGIAYVGPTEKVGPMCKGGVVFNYFDESLETLMFQLGVPKCVVTETPGTGKINKRVTAQVSMINRFIELCTRGEE